MHLLSSCVICYICCLEERHWSYRMIDVFISSYPRLVLAEITNKVMVTSCDLGWMLTTVFYEEELKIFLLLCRAIFSSSGINGIFWPKVNHGRMML